jgi:hypothetical protein
MFFSFFVESGRSGTHVVRLDGRACRSRRSSLLYPDLESAQFHFTGDLSFGFMPVLFLDSLASITSGTPKVDPDRIGSFLY